MKSNTLAMIAGGALVLAAAAALVVTQSRKATSAQEYGGLVYPDLSGRAGDVATIEINSAGTISTLRKQGSAWVLAEKDGYPVKVEKVREVVVGLGQLKQVEPKTSRPDRYADIGVEDPPARPVETPAADAAGPAPPEKSQAAMVTLKDASGATVASAVIGKQRFGNPPTVFVRKAGEAQSWLAEGRIEVPREVNGWFDTQVINLSRDRVKRATITPGEEGALALVVGRNSKDDANFTVESLPEGAKLKAPAAADPAATALSWLNFDDVALASAVAPAEGPRPTAYTVATFDGMVVTARVYQKDGKYWSTFEASVDETSLPKAPPTPGPPPAPAEGAAQDQAGQAADDAAKKAADEAAKKADEVRKEVKAFNDRHGGWAYAIPEYKAKVLVTRLDELLAEAEEPATTQGPGVTGQENPSPAPGEPR